MNRDILITGATGLIGGEIAWRLMRAGRRVWCVVRSKSFPEAAARLERRFALSGQSCDWSRLVALPGDVTHDLLGLNDATLHHLRRECSHVIHCAADTSFAAHNRCAQVNLTGTRNVLNLSAALGPHVRLFHTSSAVVCLERRPVDVAQAFEPAVSPTFQSADVGTCERAADWKIRDTADWKVCATAPRRHPASGICLSSVIHESAAPAGFRNDYVLSKRNCEQLVLQSPVNAVVLRPSIVLSHGVHSPEFARSILWVLSVMRRLGVLPLTGDEPIDAVSVQFVAGCVARMLDRPLRHCIYHLSAGLDASVTLRELFQTLDAYLVAPVVQPRRGVMFVESSSLGAPSPVGAACGTDFRLGKHGGISPHAAPLGLVENINGSLGYGHAAPTGLAPRLQSRYAFPKRICG